MDGYQKSLAERGFFIKPNVLDSKVISALTTELESIGSTPGVRRRGDSVYGVRNLLNVVPAIRSFSESDDIKSLVIPILGIQAKAVKGIYFDKNRDANWKVAWHQDLTITVKKRIDVEGFSAWTTKSGITHVQPPSFVLEKILTLRIYLDDSDETTARFV